MPEEPPGFLRRWSARKLAARDPAAEPGPPASPAAADVPAEEPFDPASLPDVDSLDGRSDFTPFLRAGVPEDLHRLALRKLWRSDPVLANLDGLNDYDEDFSQVGKTVELVKTAYRVGKGFLDDAVEAPTPEGGAGTDGGRPGSDRDGEISPERVVGDGDGPPSAS